MPSKAAMRDSVSAVRSRLPHLANLSREKIELALLYYESNIEETIEAFQRDGAAEALTGWTEKTHDRGNNANKRTNNKSAANRTNKISSPQVPPSNGILRPSQRVTNIFQTFADGGVPTIASSNVNPSMSNDHLTNASSVGSTDSNLQIYPSNDFSYSEQTSQVNPLAMPSTNLDYTHGEKFHQISNGTVRPDPLNDRFHENNNSHHQINGHHEKARTRNETPTNEDSTLTQHDRESIETTNELTSFRTSDITSSTVNKSSNVTFVNDNRKGKLTEQTSMSMKTKENILVLTKSAKDLQRQTSTLMNVEMSFDNQIKSSVKRIDDVFKQIREIIKDREVELYLEMDKVKEQGLAVIHRRQKRATELRQRMDRCDCLEPSDVDHLRNDIKHFVTDRLYDLGEELKSSHRFEYDQTIVEALKTFGNVSRIDRPRTMSTSSIGASLEKVIPNEKSSDMPTPPSSSINGQSATVSSSANEQIKHHALPQRHNHRQQFNGHNAGDYQPNATSQTNGYHHPRPHPQHYHYDESNGYQTVYRPRSTPGSSAGQQKVHSGQNNGNSRRQYPATTGNNNRRNGTVQNSETENNRRRPRPAKPMVNAV